ncbi:MAG: F0F1 ATP synthase subunit A [Planctomycetota bacterium]
MAEKSWIAEHLLDVEPIAGLGTLGISKHVLGMFVVAIGLVLLFAPFGRSLQQSPIVPRGRMTNLLETILIFIRDDVARPFLGTAGDKFLPVLWTLFFFILGCNLLGLLPIAPPFYVPVVGHDGDTHWSFFGLVTPTGQIYVTATLALIAGGWWHLLGIKEQGLVAYVKNIVPGGLPWWLIPMLFVIELVGHVIKVVALALRLWANMTGGHAVLFAAIGMVIMFGGLANGWGTAFMGPVSIISGTVVYLLEIFVAFLQAYVFTFLVTVFLGMALHPDH